MPARVIDGSKIASGLQAEIAEEVRHFISRTGITPCLNVILMGDDPRSCLYVRKKQEACGQVGIASRLLQPSPTTLEPAVRGLGADKSVHGILVQLPLPGYDQNRIFDLIDPQKDVDVFHPENIGLLVQGRPRLRPCTPAGIVEMLRRSRICIAGKNVAVINRSNVVGKPLSSMLIQDCDEYANATVTVCHNRTPTKLLREITLAADIVVVAVGIPGFITADMVRTGQTIIDVGTNHVNGKLVGDVDYGSVSQVVEHITKAIGGVGPMTVAMLLRNTIECAKRLCL